MFLSFCRVDSTENLGKTTTQECKKSTSGASFKTVFAEAPYYCMFCHLRLRLVLQCNRTRGVTTLVPGSQERDPTSFPGPSSTRPPERVGVREDPRDEVSFPVLLYIQEISFCIIFFKSFLIYKSVINQESLFRLFFNYYFGIFI